jgi:YSIRK-targeted surface antigen transcriptional regulator
MREFDLDYLGTSIGSLSGIPIRIYEDGLVVFSYFVVQLPRDPMNVYRQEIGAIDAGIGYYVTDQFYYYGIVNVGVRKIVMGPTRQIGDSEQELRELAFRADVSAQEMQEFMDGMKAIVRMPLESLLQMLCVVNYVLGGEKKTLAEIAIYDAEQDALNELLQKRLPGEDFTAKEAGEERHETHNTYDLEQTLMHFIRKGDYAVLREWIAHAPAVRGGVLAGEQLRQRKNTFIVTATLASRAAIQGGMDVDDAFTLSDSYIQRCELLHSTERLTNLQYHMVLQFAERVERLHMGKHHSRLTVDVANYIQHHISEAITVEEMAKALYMSRSYLSRRFKAETGEGLAEYILIEKTKEAKRLLRYSDKALTSIAGFLGFSSQSHFSRVFKKYAGLTPGEYRQRNTK